MAAKDQQMTLDVWIVQTNTVYRDVPFSVVVDWVQQSRLLAEDQVRAARTKDWIPVSESPALEPYLPRAEPLRADDQAEALEPVQVDFRWKRRAADEDDDVDMIPLIDISLVLLIFFMMTASVTVASARIDVPDARYGDKLASPDVLWIAIDRDEGGTPVYSFGRGERPAAEEHRQLDEKAFWARFAEYRAAHPESVNVRIAGHRHLPYEVIQRATVELEKLRGYVRLIQTDVNERGP